MFLDDPGIDAATFRAATGWEIKPEGACKGDVCVPLGGEPFTLATTAERLGMAVLHDPDVGLWAVGPESLGDRALVPADADPKTL